MISGTNGHPRANMTVTHLEVLAGKKGTIGTWSMEKSKAKHAATEDIPDAQFYEILARYALTKEQVWSLTQFYSVDFSKSRIGVKKCVFNKRTIKVCVSCC